MNKLLSLLLFCSLFLSKPVFAHADHDFYIFDKSHTQILLKINHLGFSDFYLEVMDYKGGFYFETDTIEESMVTVTIDANSIDSDNAHLNEKLKGEDFFNTKVFPDISFKASQIKMTGENTGLLMGMLAIKGIVEPLTLDVTFNKAGENPFTKEYHAGFSATGKIKRSDYGITYGLPALGDEVEIILEVEAIRR